MACLRSFSRKSLYAKWFCMTSRPVHHHIKNSTESSFLDSSLLIRRFHRQAFFEDSRHMSFFQPVGSKVLLCRNMCSSSKPEESYSKVDAFGNVVEELVPEKSVEVMATNISINECTGAIDSLSSPENCVQYVINGIHELTGFNWWISIVLTTFLVYGLMSPLSLRLQRQIWELVILDKHIQKGLRIIQTADPKAQANYRKWVVNLIQRFLKAGLSAVTLAALHAFIHISFLDGINTMAKKIPALKDGGIFWFTDLSTPESFYILPLMTVVILWMRSEIFKSRSSLVSRMMRLPLFLMVYIAFQAIYNYEPAVYFYIISFFIYISTLLRIMRSKQQVKLRRSLGLPDVPVAVSEQQRIMARVISLIREFLDEVKKKDNK